MSYNSDLYGMQVGHKEWTHSVDWDIKENFLREVMLKGRSAG